MFIAVFLCLMIYVFVSINVCSLPSMSFMSTTAFCPSCTFLFLSFANFFFHIDTLCPPLSSYYVHYCMLSIYLSLKTPTNGLYLSISIVVNFFFSRLVYTKPVNSRYITFILIHWMLQKGIQGSNIILTELS